MHLGGQAGNRGYAMAAVLVSVAVLSILMTALLPVWRQQMQREKEAELAFRGEQYARAIDLYQRSNGGQNPPSLEALVSGRFIRKKYKDPMSEDGEFLPLAAGANQPTAPGGPGGPGRGGTPQRGSGPQASGPQRGGGPSPGLGGSQPGGVQGGGGIITVVSKNKDSSIRVYNGATHYNEWRFVYNRPGRQGGPGGPGRGGPGGGPMSDRPGTGPPGRGGPPPFGPGRGGGPGRGRGDGRGGGPGRGMNPGGRGQ